MHFLTAKTTKQTAFLMPLEIPFSEWACDVTQVKKLLECSIGEITFLAKLAYSTISRYTFGCTSTQAFPMCHQARLNLKFPRNMRKYPLLALKLSEIGSFSKPQAVKKREKKTLWYNSWQELIQTLTVSNSIGRCWFCMTDINASHNILFMDILHIFYRPFKLFTHFKYQSFIGKTCTYLFLLQIRPTGNSYFWFQKRWRMKTTNSCSELSKWEKQKFDHFSLKSSRGTQGVAENMTVCN